MTSDGHFDARVAATYDADHDGADPSQAVEVLAGLSEGAPVLEFAIGTGRVALPLTARGVEVHGIELSTAMVAAMRAKPGGQHIPVTIGDMATAHVDGAFGLVFLVFNTINNLTTQEAQVACSLGVTYLPPGVRPAHRVSAAQSPRGCPPRLGTSVTPRSQASGGSLRGGETMPPSQRNNAGEHRHSARSPARAPRGRPYAHRHAQGRAFG